MEATTAVREPDAVCTTVVEAIADHADADPLDLPPLAHVIDTDALDSLVGTGCDVRVSFTYDDYDVLVRADGTVTVDDEEYDPAAEDDDR